MPPVDAARAAPAAGPRSVIAPGSVDALLFDLGGVVIEIDFGRVFARWAAHAGCAPAALRARFSQDAHYRAHERGEIDAAAYFASLRSSLDVGLSDAQFREGWDDVFVGEMPGVPPLLRRARARLPLYLFTNSNAAHQQVWSRRFGSALACFASVFVSSEIGRRKPEPDAYRAVADAIGVPPQRIAFFDDTPENVAGARAVGMHAVLAQSAADLAASLREIL